jgi:drug/metabolite transporter (DMT)-like permease
MIEWYYLALFSALFSAAAAVFEKKVLFKEKALSFSVVLALLNLLFAIPFFFFIDFSLVSNISLFVLLFKSLLGAGAFLFVMLGIKNLEISKALPLLVLTPGLVAFFAWIFLGESLSLLEIIGMFLLIGGSYLLQLGRKQGVFRTLVNAVKSKGNQYIFFALILFTITSILDKALLKNFNLPVSAFMAFQHLFLAIIFIVFLLFSGNVQQIKTPFRRSLWIILLISFFTIFYRYFQIEAVKIAPVALVLSIKRISVFFAVIIGGKLFKDSGLLRRIIATTIMVVGALLIINF